MLTFIATLPLGGAILLTIVGISTRIVKIVGLSTSLLTFWVVLFTYLIFDNSGFGYQLSESVGGVTLAIDGISLPFVILTGFLTPIVLLASWHNVRSNTTGFVVGQLLIEGLLMLVWLVTDLFSFYVAFEAVLIPLFITVGVWGSSATRVRSAFLLFIFTLSGSLFILMGLIVIYGCLGTADFNNIGQVDLNMQVWAWGGVFLAFAIKTPIVPFHIWLPRAHADAPLAASIVLAGTVLKMATYGYLRLCVSLIPTITAYFLPIVQSIGGVSLIYASLATIRQSDMKALIAYSSIGHMAVVVLGIFSNSIVGIIGGVILSIAHGFISPALFIVTGGVLYDRYHTRTLYYYRGLHSSIPVFSVLFFIIICGNMGVPLTLNWIGEFQVLLGILSLSAITTFIASIGIVLSAIYSVWLYVRIVAGSPSPYLSAPIDLTRREFYCLIYLIVPTVVFGVYTDPLSSIMSTTMSGLIW